MIEIRYKLVLRPFGPRSKEHPKLFGLTTYPRNASIDARIWVNFRRHYRQMRKWHSSTAFMLAQLIGTVDHEMVHASLPEEERREEKLARAFERAGSWARKR